MPHTRHETGCFFGSKYGHQRIGPKYSHARKKTAGYHLFRNVLPECHSILGSQLTAAASYSAAMFGRGGRVAPAVVRAAPLRPVQRLRRSCPADLNGHLSSDLDHAPGRNVEINRRIVGEFGEADEEPVLPPRHPGMDRRPQQSARQEERSRHDVELPTELARQREGAGDVWRFHEAEPQSHPGEGLADRLDRNALGRRHPRPVGGFDGQNDVLLVQHLVVLETVQQRRGSIRQIPRPSRFFRP
jgi:hypothetical protein